MNEADPDSDKSKNSPSRECASSDGKENSNRCEQDAEAWRRVDRALFWAFSKVESEGIKDE